MKLSVAVSLASKASAASWSATYVYDPSAPTTKVPYVPVTEVPSEEVVLPVTLEFDPPVTAICETVKVSPSASVSSATKSPDPDV